MITPNFIPSSSTVYNPTLVTVIRSEFKSILDTEIDSIFLNQNEFGVDTPIKYIHSTNDEVDIKGIFDNAYISVDPDTGAPMQSTGPMITIRASALQFEPNSGDSCIVNGIRYNIIEAQPDGLGLYEIRLHKVS